MRIFLIQIIEKGVNMLNNYPDVMSVQQICDVLHIGKNTAYKLINNKKIKSIKIGKIHKIPKIWLIEYITKIS